MTTDFYELGKRFGTKAEWDALFEEEEDAARASSVAIVPFRASYQHAITAKQILVNGGWDVSMCSTDEKGTSSKEWELWLVSGNGTGFDNAVARAVNMARSQFSPTSETSKESTLVETSSS